MYYNVINSAWQLIGIKQAMLTGAYCLGVKTAAATDQSVSWLTGVTAVQMNDCSYLVYF